MNRITFESIFGVGSGWWDYLTAENVGKPGSPCPRPREGLALKQGYGETGFPHLLTRRRVWEGYALPRRTFFHPVGVRRSRMDGWCE